MAVRKVETFPPVPLDMPLVNMRAPIRSHIGADVSTPRADHAGTERPDRCVVRHVIGIRRGAVAAID
jgi:hypothetical protein